MLCICKCFDTFSFSQSNVVENKGKIFEIVVADVNPSIFYSKCKNEFFVTSMWHIITYRNIYKKKSFKSLE